MPPYQSWKLNTGTPLLETPTDWDFLAGDYNGDRVTDILGIRRSATGTNSTEVHILDGASGYQSWILNIATPLPENPTGWDFLAGDYNRDGVTDLFVINKSLTGINSTEVHILDGASGYQSWILNTATPLPETPTGWDFLAGDYNGDRVTDILGINKSATGTKSTEVHILDGASGYQSWILNTATPLPENPTDWEFLAGDYNGDRVTDILGMKKTGTGTNSTEVHILDGASGYQSWILNTATPLPENPTNWDFLAGDYSNDGVTDIIGINKSATGTKSTEVHILDAPPVVKTGEIQTATTSGTEGPDTIDGSLGDDSRYGYGGNDWLRGYDGNDYLNGGTGDDVLEGGAGNDRLFGLAGSDTLWGGDGDDVLEGDPLPPTGDYRSRNFLIGGLGKDTLTGGPVADSYVFYSPNEGPDTITSFETFGEDEIRISAQGFSLNIDQRDAIMYDVNTRTLFVGTTPIAIFPNNILGGIDSYSSLF